MYDTLWPGGPRFLQSGDGYKLSTDSVLLAHFAAPVRAGTIFDLGCGAGVLTVLLGLSHPGARLEGVELQAEAAALCRRNLRENGLPDGGIVTGETSARLRGQGLSVERALAENDAYPTLAAVDGLVVTGPTGTNVNDIAIGLVDIVRPRA